MVHDDRREVIRVRSRDAAAPEAEGRLRHVELDDPPLADIGDGDLGRRLELRGLRQGAEHAVELARERRRVDGADDGDLQIVAPEELCAQSLDVGAPEPLQRFEIAA